MGDGGNHRPTFRRGRTDEAAAAGASYLPPTAASTGYGSPEGQDDYYDDYDAAASQASYGEEQVSLQVQHNLYQVQANL